MQKKIKAIEEAVNSLAVANYDLAKQIIDADYPFVPVIRQNRSYTVTQKMRQFKKDGFTDRYTGDKLCNPGILKVLSHYLPDSFPYQKNAKMDECHIAYWELMPTIDHIYPIALGGEDGPSNWVTTSMLSNSIKSNWTLEQVHWKIVPAGNMEEWDGLTAKFIRIVEADPSLQEDKYIKDWYRASVKETR